MTLHSLLGQEKTNLFIENVIEVAPLAYWGNFRRIFCILDEAQNTTQHKWEWFLPG